MCNTTSIEKHVSQTIVIFDLAFVNNTSSIDVFRTESFIRKVLNENGFMTFLDTKSISHQHCPHLGQMYKGDDKGNMHEKYIMHMLM